MEFDIIFQYISKFGLYQKLLIAFGIFPFCLATGFQMFNVIFMTETPDYWCKINEFFIANFSEETRRNLSLSIVPPIDKLAACLKYKNTDHYFQLLKSQSQSSKKEEEIIPCTEWEFDKSQYQSTIITDWQLVCKDVKYQSIILTIQQIGGLLGSLIYGFVQDKFGRKKSMTICIIVITCVGFIISFSPNIYGFAAFRFLISMEILPIMETTFTLGVEWVAPDKHSLIGVGVNAVYAVGALSAFTIAYLIRSWNYFAMATSLPLLILFINCWVLPETPRWLLTKGKIDEAEKVLRRVAKFNKISLPPDFRNILKDVCKENEKSYGALDLIKTPNMRIKTLVMFFIWWTTGVGYMGFSYYANDVAGNQYANFLLSSGIEIPSYFIFLPITEKWGRRWPLFLGLITSVALSYTYYFISADQVKARTVVFLLAKFFMAGIFTIIFAFSGEIFPTVVRGIGSGLSLICHYLGYIVTPFTITLEPQMPGIPLVIFGTISLAGALTVLILPETNNAKLPDTIEEGEAFGKDRTFRDIISWRKKVNPSNSEVIFESGSTVAIVDKGSLQTVTSVK